MNTKRILPAMALSVWACTFAPRVALAETVSPRPVIVESVPDEPRYEFLRLNGRIFRADRYTGKIEPVILSDSNDAKGVKPEASGVAEEQHAPKPPKVKAPSNRPPVIEQVGDEVIPNEPIADDYVPRVISDVHRRRSQGQVNGYKGSLGIIQAVQLQPDGSNITGTIAVTNKGTRKLLALELTLFVPLGDEKFEEHHFLMGFQEGQEAPPAPAAPGQRSPSVNLKVDIPAPSGIQGKFDIKVTYIKFAEE